MGTITTLRPSATSSGVGWTPSAGTLHGVTSDDNDTTYATWSGDGSALILATPVDSPPAGERRHQVRLRARGEDGNAWWAVRLSAGNLVAGAAALFGASPETVTGSWGTGAPADGSTVLSCYVTGQTSGVRITELYLDMDSRLAPTFTPQILDGSGSSTTMVSDTAQPTIRADALDLDDLAARQYRYWVTLNGAIVWDTGTVSGSPINRQTVPLDNGDYVAHLMVWSTLGANTAYASDEGVLEFTVSVGAIPAPDMPTVTPQVPFYSIEVCAPDVTEFDGSVGWVEIQRVDCPEGGYLLLPGTTGSYASTVGPVQVEDLEITVLAARDDGWHPAEDETLVANYLTTGDQRAWRLSLDADGEGDPALAGRPVLVWSTDGTVAGNVTAYATDRAPIDPYGRVHLRVHLDVDNGVGGWTVTFEYLDGDGVWQSVGEPVTGDPPTSLNPSSTADLTVGAYIGDSGALSRWTGRIYSLQVRVGHAGEILASPDFTDHMVGTQTFTDDQGNVWDIHAPASLTSSQTLTSLAILGPLTTDECATWVDFTIPRSGVGRTCDHEPDECCSYYRARTIVQSDGSLLVSDWSADSGPDLFCLTWSEDEHLIRTTGLDGPMYAVALGKLDWTVDRPFTAATGVNGARFVTSAPPGGRNLSMTAAVQSEAELASLRAVLARPLVLISPSDASEVWGAPVQESVKIVRAGRIRQVTAAFTGTGPEPPPQVADVGT